MIGPPPLPPLSSMTLRIRSLIRILYVNSSTCRLVHMFSYNDSSFLIQKRWFLYWPQSESCLTHKYCYCRFFLCVIWEFLNLESTFGIGIYIILYNSKYSSDDITMEKLECPHNVVTSFLRDHLLRLFFIKNMWTLILMISFYLVFLPLSGILISS